MHELYDVLKEEGFDDVQQHAPVSKINALPEAMLRFGSDSELDRYWFIHNNKHSLIQIQKDRFWYNWRKTEENPKEDYPRYEEVIKRYRDYYAIISNTFSKFGQDVMKPEMLELTYINVIELEDDNLAEVDNVFNNITLSNNIPNLSNAKSLSTSTVYAVSKLSSNLYINTQTVRKATGGNKLAIRFELALRGQLEEDMDEMVWFDTAHEVIVSTFANLTSKEMHIKWGLE
jgi:uncharacterized protein (TIGR04255 family)